MKAAKKSESEPKKRPEKSGTPVFVRLQDEDLAKLDGWLKQQDGVLTRAEAIRQLIERGIAEPPLKGGKK